MVSGGARSSASSMIAGPSASGASDIEVGGEPSVHYESVSSYELDTLSPLTRRYFDALPGAGELTQTGDAASASADGDVHGEAGSVAEGAWVRFHLRVANGIVKAALFQAYGCPHTLAVTAWLTEQLPGRSLTDGVPGTPAAWLEALDVPVEKLGRLLTVEDAVRATMQHWAERP